MKILFKTILTTIVLLLSINVANALPVFPFFVAAFAITANNDTVRACDSEPKRLVSQEGKNFNMEVTGCDYQLNRDTMTEIEVL